MSKSRLLIAIFVTLAAVSGLFLTMLLSRFFIPKGIGLAGGATVLFYGVIGFIVAFILALLLQQKMSAQLLKIFSLIFGLFIFAMIGFIVYKINQEPDTQSPVMLPKTTITPEEVIRIPADTLPNPPIPALDVIKIGAQTSVGFAKPLIRENRTLRFYKNPNDSTPQDSIVMINPSSHGIVIENEPEWFQPEYLKLDYGILYIRVKAIKGDYYEVYTNEKTNATAWMKNEETEFLPWSVFLLNMFSVEPKDDPANPVRIQPQDAAGIVANISGEVFLKVKIVRGEWMEVDVMDSDFNNIDAGWLRWKRGKQLLVTYNLLS